MEREYDVSKPNTGDNCLLGNVTEDSRVLVY